MGTFEFEKPVDEIEDAKLLDVDWYEVKVLKEPHLYPNEKMRELVPQENAPQEALDRAAAQESKARLTLFVDVETVSEDPEFTGRQLSIMLPYPHKEDLKLRDRDGMVLYDSKMQRITALCEKAGGEVEGSEATLAPGMKFRTYIKQQSKRDGSGLENRVDIFAGFRSLEDEDEDLDFDSLDEAVTDDEKDEDPLL